MKQLKIDSEVFRTYWRGDNIWHPTYKRNNLFEYIANLMWLRLQIHRPGMIVRIIKQ